MDIQIMISLIGLFAVGIKLGFDIGRKKKPPLVQSRRLFNSRLRLPSTGSTLFSIFIIPFFRTRCKNNHMIVGFRRHFLLLANICW